VAAYCRVSSDQQLTSFNHQINHYESYIRSHPNYELTGIFSDEGISGTDHRKREAFHQLMQSAKAGQIDLIITKSLSRFGRNTLDCLKNIRELRTLGVDVYFEKENIHVLRSEGEMLLTLVAAIAQNESLNQSENVKWGIRRQYERGNVKSVSASKFLGYKKDKQGNLVIDDEQAKIVRRIYQLYLDGFGIYQIAKMLTTENVPMAYGGKAWCPSHIWKVLTNEKYQGDTRFQKTFNKDYLTKRRVVNTGQLPQYYLENTHPAIIDREKWALVQLEIIRQKQFASDHGMVRYHKHNEEIPLSGKIICSSCKSTLLIRETARTASKNTKYWHCKSTNSSNQSCHNNHKLDADIASQSIITAWNKLASNPNHRVFDTESKLIKHRQDKLIELLKEHGILEIMPYTLILKVLDHIEVHNDFLNVIFLAGIMIKIDLPSPKKPQPRWTHTRKAKSQMALRRMELGLTQEQLAAKAGTARVYLNRLENGHAVPSIELSSRINEILEMDIM